MSALRHRSLHCNLEGTSRGYNKTAWKASELAQISAIVLPVQHASYASLTSICIRFLPPKQVHCTIILPFIVGLLAVVFCLFFSEPHHCFTSTQSLVFASIVTCHGTAGSLVRFVISGHEAGGQGVIVRLFVPQHGLSPQAYRIPPTDTPGWTTTMKELAFSPGNNVSTNVQFLVAVFNTSVALAPCWLVSNCCTRRWSSPAHSAPSTFSMANVVANQQLKLYCKNQRSHSSLPILFESKATTIRCPTPTEPFRLHPAITGCVCTSLRL